MVRSFYLWFLNKFKQYYGNFNFYFDSKSKSIRGEKIVHWDYENVSLQTLDRVRENNKYFYE